MSLDWLNKVLESTGNVVKGLGQEVSAGMWDTTLRWMYTAIYDAVAQFFTSIGSITPDELKKVENASYVTDKFLKLVK